jgi:uncharacterized membrane protein
MEILAVLVGFLLGVLACLFPILIFLAVFNSVVETLNKNISSTIEVLKEFEEYQKENHKTVLQIVGKA